MKKTKQAFFEYLLEKGIVEPEKFVNAWREVGKSAPLVQQAALDAGLISRDDLLRVVNIQMQDRCGFKNACQKLEFWSEDFFSDLKDQLRQTSDSVLVHLIQTGALELDQITANLDEFLGSIGEEEEDRAA